MSKPKSIQTALSTGDLIASSQIALVFEVLGDRWMWLILRDQFLGYRRFEDLRLRTGAARGTLTSRLKSLVDQGLLYRNPYQTNPARYEYRLTDKGFGLYPAALALWAWEHRWTKDHDDLPDALTHRGCQKQITPELRCEGCGELVVASDVTYEAGPGAKPAQTGPLEVQRRRRGRTKHPTGVDRTFFHAVDIIGDRWAGMVLGAIWFRLHRYDDIASAIGIATNILADRLKRLTVAGVLEQQPYRENPTRNEYRLTEKGRDLYGFTVTLHQWANDWLVGEEGPGLVLHHCCGNPLNAVLSCSECGEALGPGDVSYGNPVG